MARAEIPAKLAHSIVVENRPDGYTFTIDGEAFPWLVANSISTEVTNAGIPFVTVQIQADSVRILHSFDPVSEEPHA